MRLREQRLVLLLLLCLLCELKSVLLIETLPILMHLKFVLPPLLGLDLVWGQRAPLITVAAWRDEIVFETEAISCTFGRGTAEVTLTGNCHLQTLLTLWMTEVIVLALRVNVDENVVLIAVAHVLTAHLAYCDSNHWVLLHCLGGCLVQMGMLARVSTHGTGGRLQARFHVRYLGSDLIFDCQPKESQSRCYAFLFYSELNFINSNVE